MYRHTVSVRLRLIPAFTEYTAVKTAEDAVGLSDHFAMKTGTPSSVAAKIAWSAMYAASIKRWKVRPSCLS